MLSTFIASAARTGSSWIWPMQGFKVPGNVCRNSLFYMKKKYSKHQNITSHNAQTPSDRPSCPWCSASSASCFFQNLHGSRILLLVLPVPIYWLPENYFSHAWIGYILSPASAMLPRQYDCQRASMCPPRQRQQQIGFAPVGLVCRIAAPALLLLLLLQENFKN